MKNKNRPYDGWLVSNNFWKRAIAVWAYCGLINIILWTSFIVLILSFAGIMGW